MSLPVTALQQVSRALVPGLTGMVGHHADLTLHSAFQPILDLRDGRNIGFEGLVRVLRAEGGSVTPLALFDLARDEAELVHVDRLCRALHVCNFVRLDAGDGLLFLNVNPVVSIRGRFFGPFFEEFLSQVGLPPERVVIEILEGSVLDDQQLADSIAFYRERGCLVAIDDFGVGHSNFGRIWQIKPDIVKLDRSMLTFARANECARRALPSLVTILREAGCLVIVEGVEDEFEAMLALESRADFAQGYFFGFPAVVPNAQTATAKWRALLERSEGTMAEVVARACRDVGELGTRQRQSA